MMRRLTWPNLALLLLLLAAGLVVSARFGGHAQDSQSERGILADLISRALSSETSQVSIGAVDGVDDDTAEGKA